MIYDNKLKKDIQCVYKTSKINRLHAFILYDHVLSPTFCLSHHACGHHKFVVRRVLSKNTTHYLKPLYFQMQKDALWKVF